MLYYLHRSWLDAPVEFEPLQGYFYTNVYLDEVRVVVITKLSTSSKDKYFIYSPTDNSFVYTNKPCSVTKGKHEFQCVAFIKLEEAVQYLERWSVTP